MSFSRQTLSNMCTLERAVGPDLLRGAWLNWMPLSVSTVWIW